MTKITFDTSQLKTLKEKLKKAGPVAIANINAEVEATANDALNIATRLTPVDKGSLRSSNYLKQTDEMVYEIGNNSEYAAYVEFGTGKRVVIPAELTSFAQQFKGGTGESWDNALEEIKEWCKRQGIPEEAAYPILVSILNNGVEPQPFLYPALKLGRKVLTVRIKNYIKTFGIDE